MDFESISFTNLDTAAGSLIVPILGAEAARPRPEGR
jgi:hypothetical protein